MSERHGYQHFVSQRSYHSLQARDAEYGLVPVAIDQGLGHKRGTWWKSITGSDALVGSGRTRIESAGPKVDGKEA